MKIDLYELTKKEINKMFKDAGLVLEKIEGGYKCGQYFIAQTTVFHSFKRFGKRMSTHKKVWTYGKRSSIKALHDNHGSLADSLKDIMVELIEIHQRETEVETTKVETPKVQLKKICAGGYSVTTPVFTGEIWKCDLTNQWVMDTEDEKWDGTQWETLTGLKEFFNEEFKGM